MNRIVHPYECQTGPLDWIAPCIGKNYRMYIELRVKLPELADPERALLVSVQRGLATLDREGILTLKEGFLTNGSNASYDTIRGALAFAIHDALCEMINAIHPSDVRVTRRQADKIYKRILRAQGYRFRAWYHGIGVRIGAIGSLFKRSYVWVIMALLLSMAGCVKVEGDLYWAHRGQLFELPTNSVPSTFNIENLHEGSNTDLEGNLTGARVK